MQDRHVTYREIKASLGIINERAFSRPAAPATPAPPPAPAQSARVVLNGVIPNPFPLINLPKPTIHIQRINKQASYLIVDGHRHTQTFAIIKESPAHCPPVGNEKICNGGGSGRRKGRGGVDHRRLIVQVRTPSTRAAEGVAMWAQISLQLAFTADELFKSASGSGRGAGAHARLQTAKGCADCWHDGRFPRRSLCLLELPAH
ncbi:hypothetical protein EVAR_97411_1 [Eumeta japonica]|uniref:Uncharacterized protein n=1 Tax=Eumeta variegata TaxID=151549 RepID=A0A4C1WYN4_EUMVA|nr:hypothetical protein EVAR_97411_1 [Eumeta japonica]